MSEEQDKIFFRNFTLVVIAIAAMMLMFFVAATITGSGGDDNSALRIEKVAKLTEPVAQIAIKDKEVIEVATEKVVVQTNISDTDTDTDPGKAVYDGLCVNCHGVAALASMIPQTGDVAAWEARVAKGMAVLHDHAINGFVGELGMMPGKGGNLDLSDDEVKAAVDYMIKQVQ